MSRKVFFLFILLVIVFAWTEVSAQRIKGMLFAGMNLSQVDGDEVYGFDKVGFNTGLGAIVPLGKHFSFTIETQFNQKGAYQKPEIADSVANPITGEVEFWTKEYKLKLDYLEVPVLFHFTDNVIAVGTGFSYGRLINVKEYEHGTLVETTTLNGGPYDRNDYNVLFDLNFRLYKKISRFRINIRYAYSISKIRTRGFYDDDWDYFTRDQYNNLITMRLVYVFNEKPPLAEMKK
jgi:hypothetical protein